MCLLERKKNKSGIVSVHVIDKSTGKYRVRKTIGSSADPEEVSYLVHRGKKWIEAYERELELYLDGHAGRRTVDLTWIMH